MQITSSPQSVERSSWPGRLVRHHMERGHAVLSKTQPAAWTRQVPRGITLPSHPLSEGRLLLALGWTYCGWQGTNLCVDLSRSDVVRHCGGTEGPGSAWHLSPSVPQSHGFMESHLTFTSVGAASPTRPVAGYVCVGLSPKVSSEEPACCGEKLVTRHYDIVASRLSRKEVHRTRRTLRNGGKTSSGTVESWISTPSARSIGHATLNHTTYFHKETRHDKCGKRYLSPS